MFKTSLLTISALLFMSMSVHAGSHGKKQNMHAGMGHQGKGMAMKHANPLPNFMKVTMKYGDELNLTPQQKSEMVKWSSKNGPIMGGLVKDVIKAEKQLHTAALGNSSQHDLRDLIDKVLGLRLQVAKGKIACRENMRKVLTEQQWNKLVSIYKQRIM